VSQWGFLFFNRTHGETRRSGGEGEGAGWGGRTGEGASQNEREDELLRGLPTGKGLEREAMRERYISWSVGEVEMRGGVNSSLL